MTDEWTGADDAVEEVWEIRRRIWDRFGNDPEQVINYYLELEKQHAEEQAEMRRLDEQDKSAA
jgi:hypothetical protein